MFRHIYWYRSIVLNLHNYYNVCQVPVLVMSGFLFHPNTCFPRVCSLPFRSVYFSLKRASPLPFVVIVCWRGEGGLIKQVRYFRHLDRDTKVPLLMCRVLGIKYYRLFFVYWLFLLLHWRITFYAPNFSNFAVQPSLYLDLFMTVLYMFSYLPVPQHNR